jgi:8-oxo-dGTP pyrophosphatase MutT (NUDIX family)
VLNSATVVRLPERTPIDVDGGRIEASRDNAFRTFTLDLCDPAQLALLKPGLDGQPKAVEINLNGHVRVGIVESWQRDRRHQRDGGPGQAVSVGGRSRAALLDTPYAPAGSTVQASTRTSQQLIDEELEFTGFTSDVPFGWAWEVPGGVWHYDGLTPIAAIRRIAEAAGAYVLAHPFEDTVLVRPRYSRRAGDEVSPWHWSVTEPDVQILDDYILSDNRADVAGAVPAQSLVIPLWPTSATDKPGWVEPGDLVEVVEAVSQRALCAAVSVSFAMVDSGNGAKALVIEQTVTLDPAPAVPLYNQVLVSGEQEGVSDPVIRDGTAGDVRLPSIIDPLITQHTVARERGRNALAGGTSGQAASALWGALLGILPGSRAIKGNITAENADGSYTIATADGGTIRARPLPGQTWEVTDGVFVEDGRIIDSAPSLPGVTQTV